MIDEFRAGDQHGCQSYIHRPELPFCPGPLCQRNGCMARLSWCDALSHFHHSGGWDTCPTIKTTLQPEPRQETQWDD